MSNPDRIVQLREDLKAATEGAVHEMLYWKSQFNLSHAAYEFMSSRTTAIQNELTDAKARIAELTAATAEGYEYNTLLVTQNENRRLVAAISSHQDATEMAESKLRDAETVIAEMRKERDNLMQRIRTIILNMEI